MTAIRNRIVGYRVIKASELQSHPDNWREHPAAQDTALRGILAEVGWVDTAQGKELYEGFIQVAIDEAIVEDAAWYCWHASKRQAMLEGIWEQYGAFVHQQIIWVKDRPVLTRSWYMWQHEPCFMGWIKGKKPKRIAEDYPPSVWQLPTLAPGTSSDHPTQKPTEVFAIPMRQHTSYGDLCYEPFSGSGSQLIAGEETRRIVYACELNPAFVAVALERLAGLGLQPCLVEGGAS